MAIFALGHWQLWFLEPPALRGRKRQVRRPEGLLASTLNQGATTAP
jgi:hypothetical protein